MKIGIITQPLHINYGGILQNFAMQYALKQLGHSVVTINHPIKHSNRRIYQSICKTFLLKMIGKRKNQIYPFPKYLLYKIRHIEYFINKYINKTDVPLNKTRKFVLENQLDALLVGSDQTWRPMYNQDIYHTYLNFAQDLPLKKIAYASSFGTSDWEYTEEQTQICKNLIKQFDAISVREDSGVSLCKKYLNADATQVLDPTLLLDKEVYTQIVLDEQEPKSEGNLLTYILDDNSEKQSIISDIAREKKLTPFSVINPIKESNNIDDLVHYPVTKWLRGYMDAEFVVCDSFHGVVFSIIFNKPFIAIGNKGRGLSRFQSILKQFELEDRLVFELSDLNNTALKPIDWERVNKKRTELKELSINYLKQNLS